LGLSPGVTFTVAGVVQDVRIVALDEPREPQVYVPFRQIPSLSMSIVVRTAGDPSRMVPEIRQAVAAVDRNQAVFDVQPMVRRIATAHVANAIASQTMSRFAAIALFLAAIGVYGVISYSVATRKREIGVRMALGAGRRTVVCMLLRQGLRLSGIGLAAGLVFSIAASRLLSALLFEVSPRDGATFLVVSLLLAAVALIACYIPARRAAAVDPAITLRYE
jgi:putative ABC transport system permease protein